MYKLTGFAREKLNCHSCSSSPTAEMVATRPSNKKHPVQSELGESDINDDDDDSDEGKCSRMRRSRSRKKPGPTSRVTKQAKKAAATKAAAQLELEMAEMDAQQAKQDVMLVDQDKRDIDETRDNDNSPASPEQPLTKSQKVHKDVEAVKRCMLENRGEVLEGDETGDTDQDVGVVGEKRRKGKDRALSDNDGQRPSNQKHKPDILHFSSQPSLSGLHENWHLPVAVPPNSLTAKTAGVVPRNTVHPGGFEDEHEDLEDDANQCSTTKAPVLEDNDPLLAPLSIDIIKKPPSKIPDQSVSVSTTSRASQQPAPIPLVTHNKKPNEQENEQYDGERDEQCDGEWEEQCDGERDEQYDGERDEQYDREWDGQLDEQKGRENEGSCYIAQPYRHYMRKLKVAGHQLTCPPPDKAQSKLRQSYRDADTKGGRNDGAAANWKQKKSLNAHSFKAAKNAQHLKGREPDTDEDTDGNNADEDDNTDAQSRLHRLFDSLVIPMWIEFISCLDNMWDISDFAEEMQSMWDHAMPNIPHTVSRLMQCAYDYHSDFGVRAQVVIAKHIDKEGWTPKEICEVITYVTPKQHKCVNDKGETILVNPPVYPYMWKECIGDEADADAYCGAFEDPCILDTFVLYLKSNEHGTCGQRDSL
ncbi:hypothetical protein DFJ58DRAFT_841226 [Suillus subalutaceus]|uniref:uncharacterized protein n=1 Tax=Suillus subalutaceus TaxID=48586 RepID=UPI001B863FBD|nr:uncharacterized protein DFJ58DRAFT_841226 [Suillus subalutaceus]KAG1854927.1 hypothetical protein DFJ58DRAFT_841226 [Suillus subalutaceus]